MVLFLNRFKKQKPEITHNHVFLSDFHVRHVRLRPKRSVFPTASKNKKTENTKSFLSVCFAFEACTVSTQTVLFLNRLIEGVLQLLRQNLEGFVPNMFLDAVP